MRIGTSLRIATAGGLLAAALACGSSNTMTSATGTASPSPSSAAAAVVVTISGMNGSQSFSPNPGVVKAGQTVAWKNGDSIAHTATADNGSFDTGAIQPGATSKAITMTAPGSVGYHCSIHPTMVGTVTVQ